MLRYRELYIISHVLPLRPRPQRPKAEAALRRRRSPARPQGQPMADLCGAIPPQARAR